MFSGGNGLPNGEDVNYDGFANSAYVIAVGAVNDLGQQASYSEPGACLVNVAPSSSDGRRSLTTTDLAGSAGYGGNDYTSLFGGTSAAAPQVSGVVALLLQANADLSWRDVQEILLRSATRVSSADSDWATNSAGIAHNHKYGAGLVNAAAAVELATHWFNLDSMTAITLAHDNLNLPVPDNSISGITQSFEVTNAGFRVEHAILTVTLPHPQYGDLAITLISPEGTESRLAEWHSSTGASYDGWPLNSVRHWGELAQGIWKVRIADLAPGNKGTLQSLQLQLYGTTPAARLEAEPLDDSIRLTLKVAATGWHYSLDASANLMTWMPLATLTVRGTGQAVYEDKGADGSFPARFYRARLLQ